MQTHQPEKSHLFGGCDRLASQYRTIGEALARFEQTNGRFGSPSTKSLRSFRQALVFLPVEVLESYLEDLLNLSVKPERLFISHDNFGSKIAWFALLGLLFAIGMGLYAASTGATLFLSFALTVCVASPFAVLWNFSPREITVRRIRFAQLLSHEIAKRRGGGKGNIRPALSGGSVFEGFWGKTVPSRSEGAMSVLEQ